MNKNSYTSSPDPGFPQEKKNLVFIFMESMETSYGDKKHGGFEDKSLIPNLTTLAMNGETFTSDMTESWGAYSLPGSTCTAFATVAELSGMPFSVYEKANTNTLGTILSDGGYRQVYILGSDASFGGKKGFFENRGKYTVMDYTYMKEHGKLKSDEYENWGYNDKKLFEFAEDEISTIAKTNDPFNVTILTSDTHTPGYVYAETGVTGTERYKTSIRESDRQIWDFISWMKQQSFYKNTVIVLVGDHPSMMPIYKDVSAIKRTVYFTILNSDKIPERLDRAFSTYDIFPTVLSALGIDTPSKKLGIGTDLYSGEDTIIEQYGLKYVMNELSKRQNTDSIYKLDDKNALSTGVGNTGFITNYNDSTAVKNGIIAWIITYSLVSVIFYFSLRYVIYNKHFSISFLIAIAAGFLIGLSYKLTAGVAASLILWGAIIFIHFGRNYGKAENRQTDALGKEAVKNNAVS